MRRPVVELPYREDLIGAARRLSAVDAVLVALCSRENITAAIVQFHASRSPTSPRHRQLGFGNTIGAAVANAIENAVAIAVHDARR